MADRVFLYIFDESKAHEVEIKEWALFRSSWCLDYQYYQDTKLMVDQYERSIIGAAKCWMTALQQLPSNVTKITAQALAASKVPRWFVERVLDLLKAIVEVVNEDRVEWDPYIGAVEAQEGPGTEDPLDSKVEVTRLQQYHD